MANTNNVMKTETWGVPNNPIPESMRPNNTEVKPYRPAGEPPDLTKVRNSTQSKAEDSTPDSSRPSSFTNVSTEGVNGDVLAASVGAASENSNSDSSKPTSRYPDLDQADNVRGPGQITRTEDQYEKELANARDHMSATGVSVYANEGNSVFKTLDAYLKDFNPAELTFDFGNSDRSSKPASLKAETETGEGEGKEVGEGGLDLPPLDADGEALRDAWKDWEEAGMSGAHDVLENEDGSQRTWDDRSEEVLRNRRRREQNEKEADDMFN